ncbi:hypothetical protein TrRE_jg310 [Triparma retinervis]|uniref:Ionotropic glutamate receptor C-terminal domain-containing protein n=1 Tax=Triparma retinervis TaxID=2557542 RepID=A0A9W6ZGL5_9STRA|nr:hypothetical protein TrRE_jg310 [Triparma retinervis]
MIDLRYLLLIIAYVTAFTGPSSCPCIDEPLVATPGEFLEDGTTPCKGGGEIDCVPLDYGGVCKAHDEGRGAHCSVSDPPAWCGDAWCYVDPVKCRTSNYKYFQSDYFDDRYYGYQTCGTLENSYEEHKESLTLVGKTLKVALPEVKFPYMYLPDYTVDDSTFGGGDPETVALEGFGNSYTGIVTEYLQALALHVGFYVNFTYISRANVNEHLDGTNNKRYNGSSWSGCVDDIGQGILDLCMGDYWPMPDRVAVAPFSLPFFDEEWFLFVPRLKAKKTSIKEQMLKPFQPFKAGLWVGLCLTSLYCALLHHWLTNAYDMRRWHAAKENKGHKMRGRKKTILKYWLDSVTLGIDMDDEGNHQPKINVGQAVVKIAFAVIMMVASASYTANLAAMLSKPHVEINIINNIDDCAQRNCNLCVHKHRLPFLERAYPKLTNTIPFRSTGSMFDEIDQYGTGLRGRSSGSGYYFVDDAAQADCPRCIKPPEMKKCDAFMVSSKGFEDHFRPSLCDYEFKGGPIYWLPISFPVREEYAGGISYAIRSVEETTSSFMDIRKKYFASDVLSEVKPTCDPFLQSDIEFAMNENEPPQLEFMHFAGPWMLLFIATIFGIFHKISVEYGITHAAEAKAIDIMKRTSTTLSGSFGFAKKDSSEGGEDDFEMEENPVSRASQQDSRGLRAPSAGSLEFSIDDAYPKKKTRFGAV